MLKQVLPHVVVVIAVVAVMQCKAGVYVSMACEGHPEVAQYSLCRFMLVQFTSGHSSATARCDDDIVVLKVQY